jgi:hypothetical protein
VEVFLLGWEVRGKEGKEVGGRNKEKNKGEISISVK